MNPKKPPQKLVSFSDNKADLEKIKQDMDEGWSIISLMQNGNYYIGVMEKVASITDFPPEEAKIYLPPRKKIKISY